MAELGLVASQSSLLHLPPQPSKFGFRACATTLQSLRSQQSLSERLLVCGKPLLKPIVVAGAVASDTRASTVLDDNVDLSREGIEIQIEPETGGGGDDYGDIGSGQGGGGGGGEGGGEGGGGGGGGGGDSKKEGEGGSSENSDGKKKMALSMSQKLTLGYAALVGMGGLMGYLKSGSQKSLLSGGLSAAVLYYVYTQLPANPVFASSMGLGVSAALTAVMGSRFAKSGKIFPAGVVSLVSLVMTGGYAHGILRSMH